jgi:hypothetical protein
MNRMFRRTQNQSGRYEGEENLYLDGEYNHDFSVLKPVYSIVTAVPDQ